MSLAIVIPPYAEPITVTEMKEHLKIESATTADDELIEALIYAARDLAETATGANSRRMRVMLATTFDLKLDAFPNRDYILVPRVPLISVTSITYTDANGTSQTLSSADYNVDIANGRINLGYSETWPATRLDFNVVTVRFVAGMAATFTAVAATDVCTFQGRSFTAGDRVRVMNSGGALPAGLTTLTDYFLIAGDKLSLTSGGSAVDITGVGTGTHYVALDLIGFETLRHAIKLVVGHWYFNREHTVVGTIVTPLPMAVDALIASQHA